MKTMKRIADRVLVIFPFEAEIYREAGVSARWVGHPLLDELPAPRPRSMLREELGVAGDERLVALLPGSRANEVTQILPTLVETASIVRARHPAAKFVVARAPHLADRLFEPLGQLSGAPTRVVEGVTDDVLAAADVALVASGTVTVQAAIHECPMVVVYRLAPLTYRLGKPFVRVDTYAMANLVAGRRVVPELIQEQFTAEAVAAEALDILTNDARAERMRTELRDVRRRLGEPGASARAAGEVLDVGRARRRTVG
jgi:lipid-A-disaccharide synthase